MTRVTAQLPRTTGRVQCSRCLDSVAVHAGRWHAADADHLHHAVCDRCAAQDDPAGWRAVKAWRRAAAGPTTGRRWAA